MEPSAEEVLSQIKILLLNRHFIGGVWIDARYSEDGVPFCELPNVSGFPRLVNYEAPVEIQMNDGQIVLYRTEKNLLSPAATPEYWPRFSRIDPGLHSDGDTVVIMDGEL